MAIPNPATTTVYIYKKILRIFTNNLKNSVLFLFSKDVLAILYSLEDKSRPKVIISINCVDLGSMMLYAKFQDHHTSGSGKEDFQRFSPYIVAAAILVM